MEITELMPRFGTRKSFGGKAMVECGEDFYRLYSYQTLAAEIFVHPKHRHVREVNVLNVQSATTLRHVKEFLAEYGGLEFLATNYDAPADMKLSDFREIFPGATYSA
jgi:hypothetical protein